MVKLKKSRLSKKAFKKKALGSRKKDKKLVQVKLESVDENSSSTAGRPSNEVVSRKRKLSLSDSSLGNSTPTEPKLKRVSFAEKLEHTKIFEKSVKKLKVEPSTASPGKSILSKKNGIKTISLDSKETSNKSLKGTCQKREADDKTARKKLKLQVTRKVKEKLLSLPRKERKLYINELRKKRKPFFELGAQCKKIWEVIRSSKCKAAEKEELTNELFGLIKGKVKDLIYSHDTSRVIEYLTSLPRPGIRSAIFEEVTSEIIKMSKSKYAHFLVTKMLRHGTPAQRNTIIEAFHGHCVSLMRNQWAAARVLEFAYNDYANAKQRWNIISEFYGPEFVLFRDHEISISSLNDLLNKDPSKKALVMSHLEELLKDIVSKPQLRLSLTHRLLRDFFTHCSEDQRAEMIDSLKERIPEIVHTNDGTYVALRCIWHGNAKERKLIVKNFKGYVVKTAQEEFGHRVLIALFDSVDDTVLVSKHIIQELANNIRDVALDHYGMRVLNYLIWPRNPRYFGKVYIEIFREGDNNKNSKKNPTDRYTELFTSLSMPLYTFLAGNMSDLIFNQSAALLVLFALQRSGKSDLIERKVNEDDRRACYEAIAKVCSEEFIPCNTERLHAVEHPQAHFVISQLLIMDKDFDVKLSDFLAKLDPELLSSWIACNKGCFIILHMFENGTIETQKLLVSIISQKTLRTYSNKGASLLLEKLSNWKE